MEILIHSPKVEDNEQHCENAKRMNFHSRLLPPTEMIFICSCERSLQVFKDSGSVLPIPQEENTEVQTLIK